MLKNSLKSLFLNIVIEAENWYLTTDFLIWRLIFEICIEKNILKKYERIFKSLKIQNWFCESMTPKSKQWTWFFNIQLITASNKL